MTHRTPWRVILALATLIAAGGCAPDSESIPETTAPLPAEGTPVAVTAVKTVAEPPEANQTLVNVIVGDPAGPPTNAGLSGILVDERGEPIGDYDVLACTASYCLTGKSDAEGRFSFPMEAPVDVALKTHEDVTRSPRLGAALMPLGLTDPSVIDVGPLRVPDLPAGMALLPAAADPQLVVAGDGLELTLRRADLIAAPGDLLIDVAARAIPSPYHPSLPALGTETIVAVFALHPFAATSRSPIAIGLPSALPAGTALKFRTISEIDGHLSPPVPGRSDGRFARTDPATGITELTWLVVSRQEAVNQGD